MSHCRSIQGNRWRRRTAALTPASLTSVLLVVLLSCLFGATRSAQAQGAQPQSSQPQDSQPQGYIERSQPDVQILVAPLPTGQWLVSAVYPARVARADSERRLKLLLARTGWQATDIQFEDRGLQIQRRDGKPIDRSGAEDRDAPTDPVMSSVTFATSANVVGLASGSIDVAPFVLAFDDMSHVNLVYLVPANLQFHFNGLRHYDDAHLSLDLTSGQGTYTYLMNIKDHGLQALDLPKTQPAAVSAVPSGWKAAQSRARALETVLVVMLAGIVGIIVYLWATRLVGGGNSTSGRD